MSRPTPQAPMTPLEQAKQAIQEGQARKASRILQQALQQEPQNSELRWHLIRSLMQQGRLDRALPHFTVLLDAEEALPEQWHEYGLALFGLNKLPDAETAFHRAISLQSKFAPSYFSLGDVARVRGLREKAIYWYESYIRFEPSPEKQRLALAELQKLRAGASLLLSPPLKKQAPPHNLSDSTQPDAPAAKPLPAFEGEEGTLPSASSFPLYPAFDDEEDSTSTLVAAPLPASLPAFEDEEATSPLVSAGEGRKILIHRKSQAAELRAFASKHASAALDQALGPLLKNAPPSAPLDVSDVPGSSAPLAPVSSLEPLGSTEENSSEKRPFLPPPTLFDDPSLASPLPPREEDSAFLQSSLSAETIDDPDDQEALRPSQGKKSPRSPSS